MARVLTGLNDARVGAFQFPDRKRPALCVEKGNVVTVYGYFKDKEAANQFMHELAQAVGASEEV
jgi:hypothetical protein